MVTPTTERSEMGNIAWVGVSVSPLYVTAMFDIPLSSPQRAFHTGDA